LKRLVAIVLLGLFAIHQVGFYFIYNFLQTQHELKWETRFIDNDFNSDQLETKSIPIHFPYLSNQSEYQYVDETIKLEDAHYRIIKKRYANDTLHIVYVNDLKGKQIQNDFDQWLGQLKQDASSSKSGGIEIVLRTLDFQYLLTQFEFHVLNPENNEQIGNTGFFLYNQKIYLNIPTPPPEQVS